MLSIEKIVLGTVQFGLRYGINNRSGQPDKPAVFDILDKAGRGGITTLDTAEDYGTAQDIIGEYILERGQQSERFRVISKISAEVTQREQLRANIERTLETLHIPGLEAYLFHRYENYKLFPELVSEMNILKEENKIRKIGVSIYTNEELEEVIDSEDIQIVQLPLNLLDNLSFKDGLLEKAKRAGKEIHARSIFLQGLLFMDAHRIPAYLSALKPAFKAIHHLASAAGVTVESLALNYVVNNPLVDKALIGVDTKDHLTKSLNCLKDVISPEVFASVDAIKVDSAVLLNPTNWK